jgi:formate dehydrogenase maturation protein FdhE
MISTFLIDFDSGISIREASISLERSMIAWAMDKSGGNQMNAAKILKTQRTTLQSKMYKYKMLLPPEGNKKRRGRFCPVCGSNNVTTACPPLCEGRKA